MAYDVIQCNAIQNDTMRMFLLFVPVCLSMSNGVYAFLGSTNSSSSATVESFGRTFRIPYVIPNAPDLRSTTPSDPSTPSEAPGPIPVEDEAYIVYMSPQYIRAVFSLVKLFRWTRIHYLYDTTHGQSNTNRNWRGSCKCYGNGK